MIIRPMTTEKIDLAIGGEGVVAFSTLRGRLTADSPYSGFNACHYVGDTPAHVDACRSLLCRDLGIGRDHLVMARQTHTDRVAVIERLPAPDELLEETDGLVTRLRGVALAVNTADCVPLLMADAEAGVVAAVHSGWRGTIGRIAARAVETMVELGAEALRISAAIGPSICADCFEVGDEVAEQFRRKFPGDVVRDLAGCRPHVDLRAAVRHTLVASGVAPGNIALPSACSRCDSERFFSARRLGVASGRTLSVIMLK